MFIILFSLNIEPPRTTHSLRKVTTFKIDLKEKKNPRQNLGTKRLTCLKKKKKKKIPGFYFENSFPVFIR